MRQRNGKLLVTDGSFAETKEQFGGYHLVECSDLDEALALASAIPTLRVGGAVKVRPVVQAFEGAGGLASGIPSPPRRRRTTRHNTDFEWQVDGGLTA